MIYQSHNVRHTMPGLRIYALLLVFAVTFQVNGAEKNILTNPDFERGIIGWEGRNCTLSSEMTLSHGGYSCGLATDRTADWNGIKQSVLEKMQDGQTYNISGWVMIADSNDEENVYITVEQNDGSGTNYIRVASGTSDKSHWTSLSGTFTLNVTGTLTKLDVYFEGPPSNVSFYLDDVNVFGPEPPAPAADVNITAQIDAGVRYQELDGFGASGAWYENWLLANDYKDHLYDIMFKELGLDIYRIRNSYNQNDVPYITGTAQICQEAQEAVGHPIKVMLCSWSPPAYLKSNGSLVGNDGSGEATLLRDANDEYMYDEFAQWWIDGLNYWSSLGVVPEYVSIQNEPQYVTSYDSCKFGHNERSGCAGYGQALTAFLNALDASGIQDLPKVIGPENTSETVATQYINQMKQERPADCNRLYAYSSHLYNDGGSATNPDGFISHMQSFYTNFSEKPRFQTEFAKGSSDALTFNDAMYLAQIMHNALVYEQASAYLYWELFWEPPKGLVSLIWNSDGSTGYTVNTVYYAFKHFSAFTDPGWQRVDANANSSDVCMTAFISPDDNNITIIAINKSTTSNIGVDISVFGDFDPISGKIYRTSQYEFCDYIGNFDVNSSWFLLPCNSITTVTLTQTPETCQQLQELGYGLASDLNGDCNVDLLDLAFIAKYWMTTGCSSSNDCEGADLEPDNDVDIEDVSTFIEQWLDNNNPQLE